jgi:Protein of unknown function (DUF1566)
MMRRTALTSLLGAAAVMLLVPIASATLTHKCQEMKLKAQGRLALCLKRNSAKVLGGRADAAADCQAKFQAALKRAEDMAVAMGGTACRYVDNGDGTVSDLNTGLTWEKKDTTCPGVHCSSDLFAWSNGSPYEPDGTLFTGFLYGLNGGTSSDGTATEGCFAGHCDWRVPTVEELASIVDKTQPRCGTTGTCIDPIFGPTEDSYTWSASTSSNNPAGPKGIWIVHFGNGARVQEYKTDNLYVRAVRAGF